MLYKRNLTKKKMRAVAIRMPRALCDLIQAAARKEEISQSEFMRKTLEESAKRVLLSESHA